MLKIVTWNIAQREDAWRFLLDTDADIALLQEAIEPPADVAGMVEINPGTWRTVSAGINRPWRAAIVNLSNRAEVEWFSAKPFDEGHPGELAVSRPGTIAAAKVSWPSCAALSAGRHAGAGTASTMRRGAMTTSQTQSPERSCWQGYVGRDRASGVSILSTPAVGQCRGGDSRKTRVATLVGGLEGVSGLPGAPYFQIVNVRSEGCRIDPEAYRKQANSTRAA